MQTFQANFSPSSHFYTHLHWVLHVQCIYYCYCHQWLKYKIEEGGSLSISGPLRDTADISRCIVDDIWAPDLSIVKYLGPGSQIRQDPAYFNHCFYGILALDNWTNSAPNKCLKLSLYHCTTKLNFSLR